MTMDQSSPLKCELCGYALPLNADVCPECGANLTLIQLIKEIPSAASRQKQPVVPAVVMQVEGGNGNRPQPGLPVPEQTRARSGVSHSELEEPIAVRQAVPAQKPPAAPAQVVKPEGVKANSVPQVVPEQKSPATPARVIKPEGIKTNTGPLVVPYRKPHAAPPKLLTPEEVKIISRYEDEPAAEIPPTLEDTGEDRKNLFQDQSAIILPSIEEPVVRYGPLNRFIARTFEAIKSSLKSLFSRIPARSKVPTQEVSWSQRFLKDWLLPTVLIAALFFVFMEFLAKSYQARASGGTYQDAQSTIMALGNRLSQAEATISAQQNTILSLQNSAAIQPDPTLPQSTLPAPQPDLSGTLLLGPLDGVLAHSTDGLIKTFWAEQEAKNFILSVALVNPYSSSLHPWDVCIRFRRVYTDEYRLTIFSTRQWTLTEGLSLLPVASGSLPNLKTGEADSNAVSLQVMDGTASLKINDVPLPAIDVSAYQGAGDVGIAIGTQTGDEMDGKTTQFKEFTLWSIP